MEPLIIGKVAKPTGVSTYNNPIHCPIIDHIRGIAILVVGLLATSMFLSDPPCIYAKPISYVGGTMMMQENDETGYMLSLDYTFASHYAVSLYAKKENGGKEFETIGMQLNTLLKRWNLSEGQGNIFNMTGTGISHYHGESEPALWTGFLADYETRRLTTAYELRLMYAEGIEKSAWQRARIGFAPYLANYDALHTWLIVQVDHHPAKDETIVVTPLVRFFYKTILVEAGYSSNDHVMVNWFLQF